MGSAHRLNLWRYAVAAMAIFGLLFLLSRSTYIAPVPQHSISPLSLMMQQEGERLQAQGNIEEAIGYFETALVADPHNADAYIGLGKAARAKNLPGQSISLFRAALKLRPDDRPALVEQGRAFMARGAIAQARQNLARLQSLCPTPDCDAASQLATAIDGGAGHRGSQTALQVEQVMPAPVIEAAPIQN
ncbi:MAG: tetratricopeptide repeat protein [Sphingopyxis sp.]